MNFESENKSEAIDVPESQAAETLPSTPPPKAAPEEKAVESQTPAPPDAPLAPESPAAMEPELSAELPRAESSMKGHVRNSPAGAHLTLIGEATHLTTTVASDGNYIFDHLPAGTYTLFLDGIGVVKPSLVLDGKNEIIFDYAVRPQPKSFDHYLLFGPGDQPATLTHLILALDYIIRFAPLVGFSPEQAAHARVVTIVGDTSAVGDEAEQGLRQQGCQVARLTAPDSYALENLFKQLVASGSPYLR